MGAYLVEEGSKGHVGDFKQSINHSINQLSIHLTIRPCIFPSFSTLVNASLTSIHTFIHRSINPHIHLIAKHIHPYIHSSILPDVNVPFIQRHVNPSTQPPINTFIHLSFCPSIDSHIHPSIHKWKYYRSNIDGMLLRDRTYHLAISTSLGNPNIAYPSPLPASRPTASRVYSPHNNGHQPHDGFIQAVKEVS